jgi:hypothetical protein
LGSLGRGGIGVYLLGHFNIYLDPDHDFLQYNISTVFVGQATGEAKTGSDTQKAGLFYKKYSFSAAGV